MAYQKPKPRRQSKHADLLIANKTPQTPAEKAEAWEQRIFGNIDFTEEFKKLEVEDYEGHIRKID